MSINPASPICLVEEVIPIASQVLLMTVNPGFGGQSFIPTMLPKIRRLRTMIDERNPSCRLEVDGGIKAQNIAKAAAAGADSFVIGSAIFRDDVTFVDAISELRHALEGAETA